MKRLLEREGALVEADGDAALAAVLPEGARVTLGLADEAPILALDGRAGSVACGYGTELLRGACARAIGSGRIAVARAAPAASRPGPLSIYAGLNVALRPGAPERGEVWTLAARLRVDASADDRRILSVEAAVALEAEPVATAPSVWSVPLDATADRPPAHLLARCDAALARAARAAALDATAPFREAVARRARRDVERIDRYFAELDADLASRISRAPKGAAGLESKRALLPGERERRLRTLRENALVRVRIEPVALLAVVAPAARASLEVLRRKARRTLSVAWHPALRAWLPLACEGCGCPVRAFGACDDAVHVLCQQCLQEKSCPRCARGGPPGVVLHEERAALEEALELPVSPEGSLLASQPSVRNEATAAPVLRVDSRPAAPPVTAPLPVEPVPLRDRRPPRLHKEVARSRESLGARVSEALRSGGEALTSEELQERCRVFSTEELRSVLAALVREGHVERTGKARGTRYRWRGSS
jgi:hypothetical protein